MTIKNMKLAVLILCFGTLLPQTLAAKILVVFPHIYYSHFRATSTLVSELNRRGHEVTFVNPYPQNIEGYENITEISIDGIIVSMKDVIDDFFENDNHWDCYWSKLQYAKNVGYQYSKQVLENENVTKLIKSNTSFDLVIIEDVSTNGLAVLSAIFKCPLVVLLSEPGSVFYDNYISDNIPWKQRNDLRNGHYWAIKELYREWSILPNENTLVKNIVAGVPDLREILYQTSLVLMPSYSIVYPIPSGLSNKQINVADDIPTDIDALDRVALKAAWNWIYYTLGSLAPKYLNVKQVGGFHLGVPRKLSSKLDRFLKHSRHGVIVISNNIPHDVKHELEIFSYTHGYMLENILFTSDVSEVIAHPNVKLFIGDGDVYDTSLAVASQVPVLTISNNLWDQKFLISGLEEKGMAAQISGKDVRSLEFSQLIQDMLISSTRYQTDLRLASEIIRSKASPPMDEAMFWIEYVINYNGAPHLRPGKLEWSVKNHLITIIIVVTLVDIALFLVFYWFIKHFHKLAVYCGRKIHYAGEGLFKKDKPTISYIRLYK